MKKKYFTLVCFYLCIHSMFAQKQIGVYFSNWFDYPTNWTNRLLFIINLLLLPAGFLWAQSGTLEAGMYAIPVDSNTNLGTAYLSWNTTDCNCTQLYVQILPDTKEVLVAQSGTTGQATPTWIQKNKQSVFKLYNCVNGNRDVLLDQITITGIAPLQKMIGVNKFNLLYQYYQKGIADNSPEANAVYKRLGQKSIHDAAQLGFNFMRVSVSFWAGADIGIWKNNSNRYWAVVDEMLADMVAQNVKIVPVLCWSTGQFADFVGEPITEEYINPNSKAQILQKQFITEFVTRYKNHQAILFWELQNELPLVIDLPNGELKTEHLLAWQPVVCKLIRSIDPFHMISSGNSDPRPSAWNRRNTNSWKIDTKEQMQETMYLHNRWVDIASNHSYGDDKRYGVSLQQYMADMHEAVKAAHKLHYVGEYGEKQQLDPNSSYNIKILNIVKDLGIQFASPWIWEFYQFDTYKEKDYNIEPSYSHEIIDKMQELNIAMGNPAKLTQNPDITPPMSIISYPYSNHALTGNDTVWTKASDNNKYIKQIDLLLNGMFYNSSTTFPFKNPINTSDLEECMHKFITRTHDMSGNVASDSIMLYKKYNRPQQPTIILQAPNKVTITWKDNYINELAYVLQRKENNGAWHDLIYLPKQVNTYTDSTIKPNVSYAYRTYAYYVGPKWYGPSVETTFANTVTTLEVENTLSQSIQVYPNPSSGILNVLLPECTIGKVLSIVDVYGKEFYKTIPTKSELQVNMQTLNSGIYFLKSGSMTKKIIIEK